MGSKSSARSTSRQACRMSPWRSTLQPYQKVIRSLISWRCAARSSRPFLQLFVGKLQPGEGTHPVVIVAVLFRLDLLRRAASAERGHAREAHHHARIDVLRARRNAYAASSAHGDPAKRFGRAGFAAKHREHARHDGLALGDRRFGIAGHGARFVALAALRAGAEDPLHLARFEVLEPLPDGGLSLVLDHVRIIMTLTPNSR